MSVFCEGTFPLQCRARRGPTVQLWHYANVSLLISAQSRIRISHVLPKCSKSTAIFHNRSGKTISVGRSVLLSRFILYNVDVDRLQDLDCE